MRIEAFAVGSLMSNCYLVYDEKIRDGRMVDLGDWDSELSGRVADLGLRMVAVYLTHGHFDHVDGINAARDAWPSVRVHMHPGDQPIIDNQGDMVAELLPGYQYTPPRIDEPVQDGQIIRVGEVELRAECTPGHSPGGVCYVGSGVAFTGDTLFAGGIGRTDLPGGDEAQLLWSIRQKLLRLPGDTVILPGHGPQSTIAEEIAYNPWLQKKE